MVSIRHRIERLEKVVAPLILKGKHAVQVNIEDGDRCDVALQRVLDEKGLSLKEVSSITFCGGPFFDEERDLQNHPEWDILKKLPRIIIRGIASKEQWEEYLKWKEELSG